MAVLDDKNNFQRECFSGEAQLKAKIFKKFIFMFYQLKKKKIEDANILKEQVFNVDVLSADVLNKVINLLNSFSCPTNGSNNRLIAVYHCIPKVVLSIENRLSHSKFLYNHAFHGMCSAITRFIKTSIKPVLFWTNISK